MKTEPIKIENAIDELAKPGVYRFSFADGNVECNETEDTEDITTIARFLEVKGEPDLCIERVLD